MRTDGAVLEKVSDRVGEGRARLIMVRWMDVILLGVTSALAFVYIMPSMFAALVAFVSGVGQGWHPAIMFSAYALVPLGIMFPLRLAGGFRIKDFDLVSSVVNPPTWYAAIIGVCLFPALNTVFRAPSLFEEEFVHMNVLFWGGIFGVGTFCGIGVQGIKCAFRNRQQERFNNGEPPVATLTQSVAGSEAGRLNRWLQKERPIQTSEEDMFESTVLAERLVRKLLTAPHKNVSIIGPRGSGKTSVLNIIDGKLRRKADLLVLFVRAWGYEERRLTRYILKMVVKRIARRTDCLNLVTVPLHYQDVFMSNSWGVFNPLKFLLATEEPDEIVARVGKTLRQVGKRLVIFLEDIDRNDCDAVHNELYALFDYFANCDRISFVVTYGTVTHD